MKKGLSLKVRLVWSFLFMGIVPVLLLGGIGFYVTWGQLKEKALLEADAVGEGHSEEIAAYFEGIQSSIDDKSGSSYMAAAMVDFAAAFEKYDRNDITKEDKLALEENYKQAVLAYYRDQFGKKYSESNAGKTFDVDAVIKKNDHRTLAAQYDFIAMNESPLGSKHQMVNAKRRSPYAAVHAKYHSEIRRFLDLYGLYDVFLVDEKGYVVYTVFKELDFATNLNSGPWAESGLARAWKVSQALPAGKAHLEDYSLYAPSYDAPASFMGAPIYSEGKRLGTLLYQVPVDRITKIAQSRSGLGKSGEFLLFGSDRRLRVDSFRNSKTHTIGASFAAEKSLFEAPLYNEIFSQNDGKTMGKSYDGTSVVVDYGRVKVVDQTWIHVVELPSEEVFSSLFFIAYYAIGLLAFCLVAIVAFAAWTSGSMAKALQQIVGTLGQSNEAVSKNANEGSISATELSESVTEQASSLQETMASIEEISAMVNQNADSSQKARTTVEENEKAAQSGVQAVTEMINVIGEIKSTNGEILGQMEQSNREFGEIVRIISEIGEKTKVINEIVFQTKLLSFNASVEAARAGEHGKGFAVVAEEVGNLAQMSGSAATQISGMLNDSIKRVNEIVEQTGRKVDHLVEVGQDKINMGEATAARCRESLDKIATTSKAANAMVSEIAHASKEQAQGVAEINRAISQLDQVTQQNSTLAQKTSSQAASLRLEAENLTQALNGLVGFIHGSGRHEGNHQQQLRHVESHNSDAQPSEAPRAQVIELKPKAPAKETKKPGKAESTVLQQKIVANGAAAVPHSDDSGFEEF